MIVGRRGLFIAQPNQQQERHTQQRQWQWQWLDFQAICCSPGLKVTWLLYPDAVWMWEHGLACGFRRRVVSLVEALS
jgi:hypothetical protein